MGHFLLFSMKPSCFWGSRTLLKPPRRPSTISQLSCGQSCFLRALTWWIDVSSLCAHMQIDRGDAGRDEKKNFCAELDDKTQRAAKRFKRWFLNVHYGHVRRAPNHRNANIVSRKRKKPIKLKEGNDFTVNQIQARVHFEWLQHINSACLVWWMGISEWHMPLRSFSKHFIAVGWKILSTENQLPEVFMPHSLH